MRGWQARDLGPGSTKPWSEYFLIPSQTGDLKLEANIEYRCPLFWKLEGALFADAGNVWELRAYEGFEGENFSFDTIAGDWGLGIRVNLDFILVRIDLGTKVYEPCRPADERLIGPAEWLKRDNFALHFGVGPNGHIFVNYDGSFVFCPLVGLRNETVINGGISGGTVDGHGLGFIVSASSRGESRCGYSRCGWDAAFALHEDVQGEVVLASVTVVHVAGGIGSDHAVAVK